MVNADTSQRFNQLDGNIEIQPQGGKKMFFLGIDLHSGHKMYSSSSAPDSLGRCEINIMDCSMDEVEFEDNNLHMRLLDNSITTVKFRYGIMAGCVGENLTVSKGNSASAADSLVIVGNKNYSGTIDTYCSLRILNNRFYNYGTSTTNNATCGCYNNCTSNYYTTLLTINDANSGSQYKNIIANNTFWIRGDYNTYSIWTGCGSSSSNNRTHYTNNYATALEVRYRDNFYIYNNVVDQNGDASMQKSFENNGGSGTPFVSHNYIESGVNAINIPTNNEFNGQGVSLSTDANGKASGTPVDGGIYLGQYNDIDLTRNDAGTYGGPYSIDNYHGIMPNPSGGKGKVHFVEIPHFLAQPGTIQLKGGSHTKE